MRWALKRVSRFSSRFTGKIKWLSTVILYNRNNLFSFTLLDNATGCSYRVISFTIIEACTRSERRILHSHLRWDILPSSSSSSSSSSLHPRLSASVHSSKIALVPLYNASLTDGDTAITLAVTVPSHLPEVTVWLAFCLANLHCTMLSNLAREKERRQTLGNTVSRPLFFSLKNAPSEMGATERCADL